MNNMLQNSLGLDAVDADPNAIPDGKYDGVVFKSEYRLARNKGQIAHIITYKIDAPDDEANHGKTIDHWFTLGEDVKDASGNFPEKVADVVGFTPTMTDQNKQWYKKAFVDLGVPEDQVSSTPIDALVGKTVTFGVKKNGSYRNVNFVELRDAATPETTAPVSLEQISTQL